MSVDDEQGDEPGTRRSARIDLALACAVAMGWLAALVATEPAFGLVWDEGYTVRRDRRLAGWLDGVIHAPSMAARADLFAPGPLAYGWPFAREEPDGHPPVYALIGVAGWSLTRGVLPPLSAYRFGPMVLCALTAGVLCRHVARSRGRVAGVFAASLFLLMPRTFAHAHYAHYDMPMTCFWLLAMVGFDASLRDRRWAVAAGVCLGLSAGSKFTGLFAAAPMVAWTLLFDRRGARPGLRALAVVAPAAALTLYAVQPPWWLEPIGGPLRFLASNLTRSWTKPVPTMYLGRVHEFSLPWHNTAVLTWAMTPTCVLIAAAMGTAAILARRRERPGAAIWPLSWATLMVVRALPNAPGHDGVRLFLPSVATLAVLAGWAVGCGRGWLRRAHVGCALGALAIVESAVGVAQTYPYTDSYFSAAVGGLPGAERTGFELTYYWETLGPEFRRWVEAEARRREVGLNILIDETNPRLIREWGLLPAAAKLVGLDPTPRPDFVQQRRRSIYFPEDEWLERRGRPRFAIRRQGVDLLRVYPFEQYVEALKATRGERPAPHLNRGGPP